MGGWIDGWKDVWKGLFGTKKTMFGQIYSKYLIFSRCCASPARSLKGMSYSIIKKNWTAFVFLDFFLIFEICRAIEKIFLWARSGGVLDTFFEIKVKSISFKTLSKLFILTNEFYRGIVFTLPADTDQKYGGYRLVGPHVSP